MIRAFAALTGKRLDERLLERVNRMLQGTIVIALLAGVRRRNPSVIVNAIVSVAFAAMPRYFETRYDTHFHPWQRLWVSAAALVHTVGMLGPYDRIWWWDHLAHTLSGVVVAGAADVIFRGDIGNATGSTKSGCSRTGFIVAVTAGSGILWEGLEYAIHSVANHTAFDPLLVHYGRLDAIGDVVFDMIGAGIVIQFGRQGLANIVESTTPE